MLQDFPTIRARLILLEVNEALHFGAVDGVIIIESPRFHRAILFFTLISIAEGSANLTIHLIFRFVVVIIRFTGPPSAPLELLALVHLPDLIVIYLRHGLEEQVLIVLILAFCVDLLDIQISMRLANKTRKHAIAGAVENEALDITADVWKRIPKLYKKGIRIFM